MNSRETVRVGAGTGTSDDRLVPALELAERGDIDYLVFECLAERTVSRENLARSKDPKLGYSPSLHARLRMVLPTCMRKGIRIVSNMGAANPLGGARAKGPVRRYPLRNLKAFNFVIENAFGGGVTISLAQDIHGKSLSNVMLAIALPDPEAQK